MRSLSRLVCLLLILASSDPLRAAPSTEPAAEDTGLVVRIESWWLVPRNIDLDYAFLLDTSDPQLSGGGEVQTLTRNRSTVPVIQVGWRSAGNSEVGARFWEYEDGSSASTGDLPLGVGTLLSSPDFGFSVVDSANADFQLRATLVDAGVTWNHELRNGGRLGVFAGARFFRFEEETAVTYRRQFGVLNVESIKSRTDANGIGPRVALSYEHRWGRRVGLGVQIGLALPLGEIETETQDALFAGADEDSLMVQLRNEAIQPGSRQVFTHFDLALRLDIGLGAGWTTSVSYALEQWSGVRQGLRFIDNLGQSTVVPVHQDAIFEGPLIGLEYVF